MRWWQQPALGLSPSHRLSGNYPENGVLSGLATNRDLLWGASNQMVEHGQFCSDEAPSALLKGEVIVGRDCVRFDQGVRPKNPLMVSAGPGFHSKTVFVFIYYLGDDSCFGMVESVVRI
jgi:hypothetical protein